MKLVTAQDDRGTVVLASGRLDAAGAEHFAKLIEDLLRDGERTVQIDLSVVTYLSTPGLRALAQAYQNFSALRGDFRVLQPPAAIPRSTSKARSAVTIPTPRPPTRTPACTKRAKATKRS